MAARHTMSIDTVLRLYGDIEILKIDAIFFGKPLYAGDEISDQQAGGHIFVEVRPDFDSPALMSVKDLINTGLALNVIVGKDVNGDHHSWKWTRPGADDLWVGTYSEVWS